MVLFKITDGVETRRLQVTPGEITFQQLQERITSLFPETAKEASNLSLRYRDSDGDVITLSSNEEFQEVLSDLPSDHVWKLHIHTPPKAREEARPHHRVSLLDQLHQCQFTARRNPWAEFDKQLKETQELVNTFFGLHDAKPSTPEKAATSDDSAKTPTSEEKTDSSTSEGSAESASTIDEQDGGQEGEGRNKSGIRRGC